MQEVAPADRADLAGGEEPGHRRAAEALVDELGVVVWDAEQCRPRPLQVKSRAPSAAPVERASGAGPRRPMSASRTWNCTVVPTVDLLADGDGAVGPVGAEDIADEEVAADRSRAVLVDDHAEVEALAEQRDVASSISFSAMW